VLPYQLSSSRLSVSVKVIRTDKDQSATYDFLLVIHSNHEPILYYFQDKH